MEAKEVKASNQVFSAFVEYTRVLKAKFGEDHELVKELRKLKNEFFEFESKVETTEVK